MRRVIALLTFLGIHATAHAGDVEPPPPPLAVIVPIECTTFGMDRWDGLLSFAACIQDASIPELGVDGELEPMLEDLELAFAPSVELYAAAIERGPEPIKVRAAYFLGTGYVSILVRARTALGDHASPLARRRLERLLRRHGRIAWTFFDAIVHVVSEDPSLAPDVVTRAMVRVARDQVRALGPAYAPAHEGLLALPR